MIFRIVLCVHLLAIHLHSSANEQLISTIKQIKPSIVGVGLYSPDGRPQSTFQGTGFVVGNGQYVVTNYHVVDSKLDESIKQKRVIFVGFGKKSQVYNVTIVAHSKVHDIAILKHTEKPLPALPLASSDFIDEGTSVGITGFPMGAVLGLYPVTHLGIISSVTPVIIPVRASTELSPAMIKQLKNPYLIYQLDAIVYPGNSGSPLYTKDGGKVVAVVNKTFVQKTKEAAITNPSGISYAIPVRYLHQLAEKHSINLITLHE